MLSNAHICLALTFIISFGVFVSEKFQGKFMASDILKARRTAFQDAQHKKIMKESAELSTTMQEETNEIHRLDEALKHQVENLESARILEKKLPIKP
jgi:cell division ATPase FtsA